MEKFRTPNTRRAVLGMFLLTAVAGVISPGTARAGAIVGATEFTQIANNIELVMQYIKQAEQYATQLRQWEMQIQQYENMVQNTMNIPGQVWGNIQGELAGVAQIVQKGRAIAYSARNIGDQFTARYKGFAYPAGFNYKTAYTNWSGTSMDTLKAHLESIGLQSNQFATEEGTLRTLRGMSQSANGQMEAIQVGAQIAEQQVQQLQKLRQLLMTQGTAQTTYLATQQQKMDTTNAAADLVFKAKAPTDPVTLFRGGLR